MVLSRGGELRLIPALLAVMLVMVFPKNSFTAEAGATDTAKHKEENPYVLPSVTVTADKRETDIQKTPMTISVISGQDLADGGITTVQEALKKVPNLQMMPMMGGMNFMTYRGIPTSAGTNTTPLVIYIDGVPVDAFMNLDANLMDIDRIEVLRGAQSVIYGKNSLGGVINIITKKPTNTFAGHVFGRAETHYGYAAGSAISGPLKENTLYYSLSVMHETPIKYMRIESGKYDSANKERVKGQIRATPTDKIELTLYGDYTMNRQNMVPYTLGESATYRSVAGRDGYEDTDVANLAMSGKFDFNVLTFETVTTFRREHLDYQFDMSPVAASMSYGGRKTTRTETTQEFRLRSPDKTSGFSWLAGVFAGYTDLDQKVLQDYAPSFSGVPFTKQPYKEQTVDMAPFGQVEVPLTSALKLTAGLRWHYTHRNGDIKFEPNSAYQTDFLGVAARTNKDESWNALLPRLNLSYQITDDHMIYAGVSRSFIPGGFNYASTTAKKVVYDAQKAWNYEVGAKTSWMEGRLTLNPTLFYSTINDLQVMSWDPVAGYSAENAGQSTAYGAELDVAYRIMPGLDAELSAGYTHASYDDFEVKGFSGTNDYKNKTVPMTPKFTAMGALQYRHPIGFFARGEAYYTDKFYWDPANNYSRDEVVTVNARVGWEADNFDVYLYGKNIFNAKYQRYYIYESNLGFTAPPSTFGVEVAYRF